jgi:hypothetical protein
MKKADLLNSTLLELSKTLGESLDKMDTSLRSQMREEFPHRGKVFQIKMGKKISLIENQHNKAMFAVKEASRAKELIKFLDKKEDWSDISVMGGKTGGQPANFPEQANRPKDGKELDAWIKQGKAPNDTGPVYSGKNFEDTKVTPEGNLVSAKTGNPFPMLYVGAVQQMNGAPEGWVSKPIKFTGRQIWAFAGRGDAYEVEVDGQYGVLSLNGITDKPTKRNL